MPYQLDILYQALAKHFYHSQVRLGRHAGIEGVEPVLRTLPNPSPHNTLARIFHTCS